MSGYLGGHTVITVRRSTQDMERQRRIEANRKALDRCPNLTTTPCGGSSRTSASPSPRAYVVVEVAENDGIGAITQSPLQLGVTHAMTILGQMGAVRYYPRVP
jgi:hypothetical protein